MSRGLLIEVLAKHFHGAWMSWSQTIANEEDISGDRHARWEQYWVPYDELDDDVQDTDREFAEDALEDLLDHLPDQDVRDATIDQLAEGARLKCPECRHHLPLHGWTECDRCGAYLSLKVEVEAPAQPTTAEVE